MSVRRRTRHAILGLLLSLILALPARAQYQCDRVVCTLPDCHCADTAPPGGLAPSEVPQFILLTFDDAVNAYSESFVTPTLADVRNPDGRPVPRTYFVNRTYTEKAVLKALYDAGHEIANHTANHTTGRTTDEWIAMLTELEDFLVREVGIPRDQIAGFRAPYLDANDALWGALKALGYLYDSSYSERVVSPPLVSTGIDRYVWPHTLDFGMALTSSPSAPPADRFPGVWEIPLWVSIGANGTLYNMDPAPVSPTEFEELLGHTFDARYRGNRAPLGIFLHPGQMWNTQRQAVLNTFLKDVLQRPDVWAITMRGLIEWMKYPVPADRMADWFAAGCDRGWCRNGRPVAPAAPRQAAPADGAVLAARPVLAWEPHSAATAYDVQIARDVTFAQIESEAGGLVTASYSPASLAPGTRYFWRVRGRNAAGAGRWTTATSFTTLPSVPEPAALVSPQDGASDLPVRSRLAWTPSPGALRHHVQVAPTVSFADLVVDDSTATGDGLDVDSLAHETTYFWRVRSGNIAGWGPWSAARRFRTVIAPPGPVALVRPADGQPDAPSELALAWFPYPGAVGYVVQIATDPDFSAVVFRDSLSSATSVVAGPLSASTTYFWRVRAANEGGPGAWSETRRFTVSMVVSVEASEELPAEVVLAQNYPNPFNPRTVITYGLPRPAAVRLVVFDVLGRPVRLLAEGDRPAGRHEVVFDAGSLPSGTYVYVLEAGDERRIRRLTLAR